MITRKVDSSNLATMSYNKRTKSLTVRFNSGKTKYRYSPVSIDTVKEILNAKSIGSAFHRLIIAGKVKFDKYEP